MAQLQTRKPTHPGECFFLDVLKPLKITIKDASEKMHMSRKHLGDLCKGKARLTPEGAKKIALATDTSVKSWLAMQTAVDVWNVEHCEKELPIQPFAKAS